MGTVVSFDLRGSDQELLKRALDEACASLHRADDLFSTWKPESPMSRLRRGEISTEQAPVEVAEVLARCETARQLSTGWFDPWRMPGGVDPTGLVKGWAAQRAAGVLGEVGVMAAMVNAGGDVFVFGRPNEERPWRLGVRDPRYNDRFAAVVALADHCPALATSGTYERGVHVFDPFTGEPAARLLSASVTGPDLDLADALATALVVAGEDGLGFIAAADGFEALIMRSDYTTAATAGFPAD